MSVVALLGLVGLALIDSTSIGTLVLPIVMLLAPRVHVRRYLVYVLTVALFYGAVGIALVAGATRLLDVAQEIGSSPAVRWGQLILGVVLLALALFGDPRSWFGRPPPARTRDRGAARWRSRLHDEHTGYGAVIGVGLMAALIEVASMVPFLAAIGIITAADLPTVGWLGVVLVYSAVMVLPAIVLLGIRLAMRDRAQRPLTRLTGWFDRVGADVAWWAVGIVGFLVASNAVQALF